MKTSKMLTSVLIVAFAAMLMANATPTRRALLVGINNYSSSYGPSSLRGCVNDVNGIRDTVMLGDEDLRWLSATIQRLTNAQATKAAIRGALQSLATESSAGDTVVYFHSSHGGQTSGTSTYICSYNADYTDSELGADLALFDTSVNVIVIVDTCHSGGLFKGIEAWPFIDNVMKNFRETKAQTLTKAGLPLPKVFGANIGFMVACDYDELSYEDDSSGTSYGKYTFALMRACGVATADTDHDGDLQFMEMFNYAKSRTADYQTAQYLNSDLLSSIAVRTAGSREEIDDNYESNNTQETAYDLSENSGMWLSAIDGTGVQYDQDWYKIYASPGDERIQVKCDFAGIDGNIDIALFNDSGSLLASSRGTGNREFIDFILDSLDGGVYYVAVYNGNAGNTYDLKWDAIHDDEYEPNDVMAAAYDLTLSERTWLSTIDGFGLQYDHDWYKILVSSGSDRVQVDCRFTHADGNINLALYDASGRAVAFSNGSEDNEYIDYMLPSSKEAVYYVLVSYGNNGNAYDLWWDDVASVPAPDLTVLLITHSPTHPSVGDVVTFTVTVKNKGEVSSTGLFNTGFLMNRASGPLISTTPDQNKDYSGTILADGVHQLTFEIVAPAVGIYKAWAYVDRYAGVGEIVEGDESNNAGPIGGYMWTVSGFSDDSYEPNNTLASAYDLSSKEKVWLSAHKGRGVQADEDWYKIYVSPGAERVWVDCRFKNAEGNINIKLCNASGTLLAQSSGAADNEFIDFIVPVAGAYYYIAVQGSNAGNSYDLWWDDMSPLSPVHRFWSPKLGAHFYVMGDAERDRIINKYTGVWNYEAVAWYAHSTKRQGTQPVHRFWSDKLGKHFYVLGDAERDRIVAKYRGVWRYETIAWYAYPTQVAGSDPVGRFWSDKTMGHFYTITQSEINRIAAKYRGVWNYEAVAYWAFVAPPAEQTSRSIEDMSGQGRAVQEGIEILAREYADEGASCCFNLDILSSLAPSGNLVSARAYDSVSEQWVSVLAAGDDSTTVVLKNVQPDRNYLLEVVTEGANPDTQPRVRRSWFETQLEAPAELSEGFQPSTDQGRVEGSVVRVKMPTTADVFTLKIYSSSEGVVQTSATVAGGETADLVLSGVGRWYWIGGWRDSDNALVLSIWLRHEIEE